MTTTELVPEIIGVPIPNSRAPEQSSLIICFLLLVRKVLS